MVVEWERGRFGEQLKEGGKIWVLGGKQDVGAM